MKRPLLSVIIPVYNVSDYLSQCVYSVIEACDVVWNDHGGSCEVLLIDDGSFELCAEICDSIANNHCIITVVHKENCGVGEARNIGMSLSTGEYISFVDSDDMISNSMFSVLLSAILLKKSDIAVCDYTTDKSHMNFNVKDSEMITLSPDEAVLSCLFDGEIKNVIWDKLYKRNVIKNLSFPSFEIGEDVFFLFHALGKANRIVKVKNELYYYRQREGSIMQFAFSSKWLGALDAIEARHCFIVDNMPHIADESAMIIIYTCIYDGQCAFRDLKGKQLSFVINRLSKTIKKYKLSKRMVSEYGIKQRLWLYMAKVSLPVTCWLRCKLNVGF